MLKTFTILLFLLPSLVSFAQEDEEEQESKKDSTLHTKIEEVVVTGTRTYKKIIDIPYSVFRVEKKEITYGRNISARDVLADVPGLFLQYRYGNDVRISIRGFGTRSNSGVRGIRILQDGIPESEPDGETAIDGIDLTSLGGIEVVKGNLSSLYTNSPGGVVNFLSDNTFKENFIKTNNEIGEFGLRQNGVKFGVREKKYIYFLSYSYRNFTGFRQHTREAIHLINSLFEIYPDNKTSISVYGNFVRGIIRLPGSLTRDEYGADPFQAYNINISSDIRRLTYKGRIALRYRRLFLDNEVEVTSFLGLKDIEFTTNTLYYLATKYKFGTTARFTNKTKLFKHENEFSTGVDYFYTNGPITSFSNIGGTKGDDLQTQNLEALTNLGFYFQNQFSIINDKMSLLFSGRYDILKFSNDNQLFALQSSTRKFERFTPKAALNYKLTPLIALYTSYGLGFDSPSSTELENYPFSSNNGSTTLNLDIKPQHSRNFEFGLKGNIYRTKKPFLKKVFFEFTFFNTQIDDEIVPFTISDKAYFRNAAATNRTGLECGFKTELFEHTDVIINYTFTNFKYKTYISRVIDINGIFIDKDFSNNRVPAVPQHLLSLIFEKEFKLTKSFEIFLQLDADYVSKLYNDDQNSESAGSYLSTNPMMGLSFVQKKFSAIVSAGVKNVLNRKYVGFININANPEFPVGQRRYYEIGEPRSYFLNVNLTYRF